MRKPGLIDPNAIDILHDFILLFLNQPILLLLRIRRKVKLLTEVVADTSMLLLHSTTRISLLFIRILRLMLLENSYYALTLIIIFMISFFSILSIHMLFIRFQRDLLLLGFIRFLLIILNNATELDSAFIINDNLVSILFIISHQIDMAFFI